MNELERTALNEILRTVTYIAEKVDELDSKISLNDSQVPVLTLKSWTINLSEGFSSVLHRAKSF